MNTGSFSDGTTATLGIITYTQYDGGFIYEHQGSTTPELKFFAHAEGYVEPNCNNYDYIYQYKDHLGNIRLSYKDNNGNLEIVEENNYYPFGLKHKGYNNTVNGQEYTYKQFQGQEVTNVFDLNIHEWKYRVSDPAIGRFWQVDPLTEDYMDWGPYVFSGNRVIDAVELEGLEPHSVHRTLDSAAENFAEQYNGLSVRMDGEIGTVLYTKTNSDGSVQYSYLVPTTGGPGSGMVDPFATSDPLPNGAEVIGDIHTHGADNNSPRINNNTGKKEYDADSVITEDGDYNKADDMSSAIETYISSYVVGPNGTISVYSPNGAEGEERYNQTRKVSTDVAPSVPDSRTGKNEISPNLTPVVLPQGIDKDDFPKK